MNFIFISPNFPHTYYRFCDRLRKNGAMVLGVGDCPYDCLEEPLKGVLIEYYKVNSLENYDEVKEAVRFFGEKYGKIDWIESNNEYWLEQDAKLRSEFSLNTGILQDEIKNWKQKSLMKKIYEDNEIPTAKQYPVIDFEKTKEIMKETEYPIIMKPDVGVGSSHTYKIENKIELKKFFDEKPDIPYVMEDFIDGEIYSYDAIINSKSEPLFESMTNWGGSIADIVNKGLDLSYYVSDSMDEKLKLLGRKTVKAFNVKSRFVHLEFFRLNKSHKNIGEKGDFAALEVNMRPAGGYTPDMMNFAHSTDVYQIWADMIVFDKSNAGNSFKHQYCVYASRKIHNKYVFSNDEIWRKYGNNICMSEDMPELMWDTMGKTMYTACFKTKGEVSEFVNFIHKKEG